MNRVCRLVQSVGVDEVFNLSPQHVDSEHKLPPPPPSTRPRVTTKSGDSTRVKGSDARSPPHVFVEPADEVSDNTRSDTNSGQDQVGLVSLSSGTAEGHISHSGVTAGKIILPGGGLWARILNQGVPRYTREILPPEGDHFFWYGISCADLDPSSRVRVILHRTLHKAWSRGATLVTMARGMTKRRSCLSSKGLARLL